MPSSLITGPRGWPRSYLPDHLAMGVFDVFQIPYSAVQREHEDLITAAAGAGAGTLARSPSSTPPTSRSR